MTDQAETDVMVGDSVTDTVADVTRTDIVRYIGASGEFNPNHYDEEYAKHAGHSSVFANGMMIAGLAASVLGDLVSIAAVRSFQTRFASPVWPDDDLVVRAKVIDIDDSPVVTVSLRVTNQVSDVVLDGRATVECR